jgi:hypothetical protein
VLGVIGIGAYGIVLKAKDKENNEISTFWLSSFENPAYALHSSD